MSDAEETAKQEAHEMAVNLMAVGSGHTVRVASEAIRLMSATTNTIIKLLIKCETPEDFVNLQQTLRSALPDLDDAEKTSTDSGA
jgi:hypothetical protein